MSFYLDNLIPITLITRAVIIGALLAGLWLALRRADLDDAARRRAFLAVTVPLLVWMILIWIFAAQGAFVVSRGNPVPAIPLAVIIPLLVALPLLIRSRPIAAAVDATPPSWLIGLQAYRVFGGVFLLQWADGQLPGAFALPAGTGDVLTGLLALPVALYLHSGARGGRLAAVAWNIFGIADLVLALTMGTLTSPSRVQMLAFDQPNPIGGMFPTVMIPTFAVPLSLILHGLSLWQLRRAGRREAGARAAGFAEARAAR